MGVDEHEDRPVDRAGLASQHVLGDLEGEHDEHHRREDRQAAPLQQCRPGRLSPVDVGTDHGIQAEHDEAAAAVLVTTSIELANAVIEALPAIVAATNHSERVRVALEGQQSAVVIVENLADAILFANEYATEHLEIHTVDKQRTLAQITNAGAIFLGDYSPVSLGDYMAGSNHVLPTGQQAKFGAGLGVHSFLRPQQVIDYNREGLAEIGALVVEFAEAEGLPAHGEAISARLKG